jgi:hypothetical protein
MDWAGILVPLAPFVMIIVIVWVGSRSRQAESQRRAEMQKELLAKFSSVQELSEFLKSDGGKLFMPEPQKLRSPAHRVGTGILVLVVGAGMLVSTRFFTFDHDAHQVLSVAGVIVVAAGMGLLISAVVTQRLSRKWESETNSSS